MPQLITEEHYECLRLERAMESHIQDFHRLADKLANDCPTCTKLQAKWRQKFYASPPKEPTSENLDLQRLP